MLHPACIRPRRPAIHHLAVTARLRAEVLERDEIIEDMKADLARHERDADMRARFEEQCA